MGRKDTAVLPKSDKMMMRLAALVGTHVQEMRVSALGMRQATRDACQQFAEDVERISTELAAIDDLYHSAKMDLRALQLERDMMGAAEQLGGNPGTADSNAADGFSSTFRTVTPRSLSYRTTLGGAVGAAATDDSATHRSHAQAVACWDPDHQVMLETLEQEFGAINDALTTARHFAAPQGLVPAFKLFDPASGAEGAARSLAAVRIFIVDLLSRILPSCGLDSHATVGDDSPTSRVLERNMRALSQSIAATVTASLAVTPTATKSPRQSPRPSPLLTHAPTNNSITSHNANADTIANFVLPSPRGNSPERMRAIISNHLSRDPPQHVERAAGRGDKRGKRVKPAAAAHLKMRSNPETEALSNATLTLTAVSAAHRQPHAVGGDLHLPPLYAVPRVIPRHVKEVPHATTPPPPRTSAAELTDHIIRDTAATLKHRASHPTSMLRSELKHVHHTVSLLGTAGRDWREQLQLAHRDQVMMLQPTAANTAATLNDTTDVSKRLSNVIGANGDSGAQFDAMQAAALEQIERRRQLGMNTTVDQQRHMFSALNERDSAVHAANRILGRKMQTTVELVVDTVRTENQQRILEARAKVPTRHDRGPVVVQNHRLDGSLPVDA